MVYKVRDKKTGPGASSRVGAYVNKVLAQDLHKKVIKKFKRRKAYARFKGNIWAADLAETVSLTSFNHDIRYLLCVIYVFTKYASIKPGKDKKKLKQIFMVLLEQEINLDVNQINYGLIKEDNFTIGLCKSGSIIMVF